MEKQEKEELEEKGKKRKRKGSNKVVTTILIMLLLVAFLGIGFAIGSAQLLKEFTKQTGVDPIEVANEKNQTENLSVIDDRVTEALRSFQQMGFNPEDSFESDLTKLTKKELIITALKGLAFEQINYCKMNENDLTIPISIDDLNNSLKKAVPDGKISLDDLKNNANKTTSYSIGGYGYTFKYFNGTKEEYSLKIKDNNIYVIGPCGHEGPNETTIETLTEKAELNGDLLHVYQKVVFAKTDFSMEGDGVLYSYYKDKEYKTKEETKNLTETPTWNQYNTYILTFKKNGDKYYFESSELQK